MSEQRNLTQAIAQALGLEWSTRENEHTDYLVGPGLELHVQLETYANRMLYIGLASPLLAQHRSIRDIIPRIGVNPSRPPGAIAKDIERRLLPDARAMLIKLLERRDQAAAHERDCQALLSRIAGALGVSAPLVNSDHGRNHELYAYLAIGMVSVETHGTTATLKLTGLSTEVAVAVCKLIKEVGNGLSARDSGRTPPRSM